MTLTVPDIPISERFKSVQGEGVYTGTPMAFIRLQGCSVGKKICHYCDTDFDVLHSFRGGGKYTVRALADWVGDYKHVCLTGGEPLDEDWAGLIGELKRSGSPLVHVETSGTQYIPSYLDDAWICVSPKPGFHEAVIDRADEVKVIVPGLGGAARSSPQDAGWPGLHDALRWANNGKIVFLQPRNNVLSIDKGNLKFCIDAVAEHPNLRLSVQMHKILGVQ
jgi:7-carboxy-7-deazaguanine synthase